MNNENNFFDEIQKKSEFIRRETLKLHKLAPETRVASSLSDVEIFAVLYYGKILKYDPVNINLIDRDRLIVSKGHGGISLYPILADLGFFDKSHLSKICTNKSLLGGIPDCIIPGFETVNGSLGHGPGVASGIALALGRKKIDAQVYVLCGDGELYEGSVWEAVMFAGHHQIPNFTMIVDYNKIAMLDYCDKIISHNQLAERFKSFKWNVFDIDGHDIESLFYALSECKKNSKPNVVIANTVKGKGVPSLEKDSLCHIKSLSVSQIDALLAEMI